MLKSRLVRALIAAAVVVVAPAAIAAAKTTKPKPAVHESSGKSIPTVKSPAEPGLTLGISGAVGQLATGTSSSMLSWAAKAHSVNAQIIRLGVSWASVAPAVPSAAFVATNPSSPGYNWTTVDQQVEQLHNEGFTILMEVQDAPTWAEGSGMPTSASPGSWEPNATDFGQFATALATRYDGKTPNPAIPSVDLPRVADWQAWNEPNLTEYLAPQWENSNGTEIPVSTTYYRNLENAFYASVKAVSSSNYVVGAGTAPYGDPPGGQRMQPVTFDQNLFCLNAQDQPAGSCAGPTYMNAIDDHPYVSALCCEGPTWHAALAGDTSIADMYKIVNVLHGAEAAGTIMPVGPKDVWATEIGWNTDPPNPNSSEASPAALVGQWATQALYVLWSQGVDTVLWYQLSDDYESPGGWADTYTEGLYYTNGVAKPAAAAFGFPFLTSRKSGKQVQAWGRSPQAGTLTIQRRIGNQWVPVVRLKVRADEIFRVSISFTRGVTLRASVRGSVSSSWSLGA